MIKPTVGRVVWFYHDSRQKSAKPLAAIIAHVHSDSRVNLAIFDEEGRPFPDPPTSVTLIQDGAEPTPGFPYCTWMPFQIGQAAKTEQLQKQLSGST